MTHRELSNAVSAWNAGDRVRLTFLRGTGAKQDISDEQRTALAYLLFGAGKNDLHVYRLMDLMAVQEGGCWDRDEFRTATATVLATMNIRSFVERMHAALESVQILPA